MYVYSYYLYIRAVSQQTEGCVSQLLSVSVFICCRLLAKSSSPYERTVLCLVEEGIHA